MSLANSRRLIEEAQAKFQAEKARLFRPDGAPKYAPAELQERLATLLVPLRQAVAAAQETVKATLGAAEKATIIADLDPVLHLSTEDLQRANALRPFIEDTVGTLPFPQLAQTLASVAAHGGPAERAVYQRYAQQRFESTREARQAGHNLDTAGITAVYDLTQQLRDSLIPESTIATVKSAQQRMSEAAELGDYARFTLAEADGSQAQAQVQFEQTVRAW